MRPQAVDALLRDYKRIQSRCLHLETLLVDYAKLKTKFEKNLVQDNIHISPVYSLTPKGSGLSKPVEKLAIRLADGYVPENLKELQESIKTAEEELQEKRQLLYYVESWLSGLTEKERFILKLYVMEEYTWRDLSQFYQERYAVYASKSTLKRMKQTALEKIYEIAA